MAGRQFNRLRKQLGADLPPAPPSEESSSEEENEVEKKPPFNPFELLTDDEVRITCVHVSCRGTDQGLFWTGQVV